MSSGAARRSAIALGLALAIGAAPAERYDLVIAGGRVVDPESGSDAIANLGIRAGRIAVLTPRKIDGRRVIDASGLVVAPGFIDLHAHGQHVPGQRLQLLDGVTTAIEAETGAMPMRDYLAALEGRALINFGATASHQCARAMVLAAVDCRGHAAASHAAQAAQQAIVSTHRQALTGTATPAEISAIVSRMEAELRAGALGYGVGIEYTPGASRAEIFALFKSAAVAAAPVFVHVRRRVPDAAPGVPTAVAQEVIADAAATGAPLQLVHVHSTGLKYTREIIDIIEGAQARGLDITSEAYPYEAGSTAIGSEFFAPGWQQRSEIDYGDLQWAETGERLTKASFDAFRAARPTGTVIVHMIPKDAVDAAIASPAVAVASDGMAWRTKGEHPRGAGTFARVLGRYVRERRLLSLNAALAKMTIMPARRLQAIAPAMRRKGRLAVGADADVTVFDPATVLDMATFDHPMRASRGMRYVLVGGQVVVDGGRLREDIRAGRAIVGRGQATNLRRSP